MIREKAYLKLTLKETNIRVYIVRVTHLTNRQITEIPLLISKQEMLTNAKVLYDFCYIMGLCKSSNYLFLMRRRAL